jgi:hypothetical protein
MNRLMMQTQITIPLSKTNSSANNRHLRNQNFNLLTGKKKRNSRREPAISAGMVTVRRTGRDGTRIRNVRHEAGTLLSCFLCLQNNKRSKRRTG